MNKLNKLALGQFKDEAGKAPGQLRNSGIYRFKNIYYATALLCAGGLAGCSSNYVIHTVDGKVYNTQGEPQFADGGYKFIDAQGNAQQLMLSQVSRVQRP